MKTFLDTKHYFYLVLINLLILLLTPKWCFFISLILTFYILYLFRNPGALYKDNFKNPQNIFLAPIYGEVKQIRHNVVHSELGNELTEINLSMLRSGPVGLYLPIQCEVTEVLKNKESHFLRTLRECDPRKEIYLPSQEKETVTGIIVKFKSIQGQNLAIQIVKGFVGIWPKVWLAPGDIGRPGACFGFLPLGGTVLLYLPKDTEILIRPGTTVSAGQTTLAAKL